ncbi:MAG TPA: acyl-CoA dehydrogenase family protein [Candidatus Binataceae bacterium]|nr:acyl-CoA dehydrogenase family protein [Candidatus Binataceae bacterium]
MDFALDEDHRIFRDSLRKFLESELRPLDEKWGDEEMVPERARQLTKMLVPWGYLDGRSDPFISCIMTEELARIFPSAAGIVGMTAGAGWSITRRAHPEVAMRLGPPLLAGELIGANAISEPNVGSDPSSIQCRAERKGDGYVISGTKCWISNGHIADVVVLVAQTDPKLGPAGVRQFVVDRRESPFKSRDIETIGLKAFPTSELFFDDVAIPATHRLDGWAESGDMTDPAKSFPQVLQAISAARVGTALISVGIAQRAFEIALAYVKVRKQFGKEIARFQLVQEMIAEMATDIDAARLLCYRAMQFSRKERCDAEVSMAKAYATEMGVRVASKAIQAMGAIGLAVESKVERCLRDARMLTIPDGTTQIQNLIIGRALTGMSAIR